MKFDIARQVPVDLERLAVRIGNIDLPQAVLVVARQLGVVTGVGQLALDLGHHFLLAKYLSQADLIFCQNAVLAGKSLKQQLDEPSVVMHAAGKTLGVILELGRLFERL